MSRSESSLAAPTRILLRTALMIVLIWGLAWLLPQYLTVTGGIWAYVLIGITLALLNIIVRPILNIVTFPLKLFATMLAVILVNAAFLWLLMKIVGMMDQSIVQLAILGGTMGWIIVSLVIGFGNWVVKEML